MERARAFLGALAECGSSFHAPERRGTTLPPFLLRFVPHYCLIGNLDLTSDLGTGLYSVAFFILFFVSAVARVASFSRRFRILKKIPVERSRSQYAICCYQFFTLPFFW